MKKITELIKPFMAIIFGVLLLLTYLNYLSAEEGKVLAIGICAVVISAYYFFIGIFGILGPKLRGVAKKITDAVTVSAFPLFMFVIFLMRAIAFGEAKVNLPGAWLICIISIIGAIGLGVLYIVSCFVNNRYIKKFAQLFGFIFILVLVLNVIFEPNGDPEQIGDVEILVVAIDAAYIDILFSSFPQVEKKKEEPKEEVAEEKAE